jgi:hypothetical protein
VALVSLLLPSALRMLKEVECLSGVGISDTSITIAVYATPPAFVSLSLKSFKELKILFHHTSPLCGSPPAPADIGPRRAYRLTVLDRHRTGEPPAGMLTGR